MKNQLSKQSYILILFSLWFFNSYSQSHDRDLQNYIDSIANPYMETPGFTILVARDGNIIYKKAYGYANFELKIPNQTSYSFAIGSLSKQFTSVAILKLAEENKLSIKDKVIKYLPWLKTQERDNITIEHLLTHTSGMKDFFTNEDFVDFFLQPFSQELMLEYLKKEVLFESTPGSQYKYNNAGYVYLSLIIAKASGMSFEDYMENEIFAPLDMDATFVGSPNKLKYGTVTGYNSSSDDQKKIVRETYLFLNLNWVAGAGTIYSSVEDMFKWNEALYTNKIINSESLSLAQSPFALNDGSMTKYGYGFEVDNKNSVKIIKHSGWINGFLSNMISIPKYHLYIIAMSNLTGFNTNFIYDLATRISE